MIRYDRESFLQKAVHLSLSAGNDSIIVRSPILAYILSLSRSHKTKTQKRRKRGGGEKKRSEAEQRERRDGAIFNQIP
jgi:hypothetical protein